MKTRTTLLLATAIAGSLTLTALSPAFAQQGQGPRFEQREEMAERGGMRGMRGDNDMRGGPGGFLRLMCSEEGAERLEAALGNVGERITLTDEQKTLLDDLKTAALTAQTEYADTCITGPRDGSGNMVDALKHRQENMKAQIAAMDDVIPALEAFYDSLTDEQKAGLKPSPRGEGGRWGGQGHQGKGPMRGHGRG